MQSHIAHNGFFKIGFTTQVGPRMSCVAVGMSTALTYDICSFLSKVNNEAESFDFLDTSATVSR